MAKHGPNPQVIAKNVRRLRDSRGWTQEELAEGAGVSSVKMIETGHRGGRVATLQKIARALEVPLQDLFEDGGEDMTQGLADFLASSLANKITHADLGYLRSLRLPGPTLTA
jgi:transcriptional regulator with XRE-family HTH domain